jgi:hypothetical protein
LKLWPNLLKRKDSTQPARPQLKRSKTPLTRPSSNSHKRQTQPEIVDTTQQTDSQSDSQTIHEGDPIVTSQPAGSNVKQTGTGQEGDKPFAPHPAGNPIVDRTGDDKSGEAARIAQETADKLKPSSSDALNSPDNETPGTDAAGTTDAGTTDTSTPS